MTLKTIPAEGASARPATPARTRQRGTIVKGAASFSKGLELLDIIAALPAPPRFQVLQRETGYAKATLHRMLSALIERRLVRLDRESGTYHLGMHLLELAYRLWDQLDIRAAAIPVLERLSAQVNETASLVELDGTSAVYIEQRFGPSPLSFRVETGSSEPLHCSAAGKVMLAYSPDAFLNHYLEAPLERFTARTIVEAPALRAELGLVKARGYAVSDEEKDIGLRSVAAAILNPHGKASAAICVSGLRDRMTDDRLHAIGSVVMGAAREVSGLVGINPMSLSPPRRTTGATMPVQSVTSWSAHLGEGPLWSDRESALYWLDILAPAIHRFDPVTGENSTRHLPQLAAAIAETDDGLVALTQDGLQRLDLTTGALTPISDPEVGMPHNRFNDGKVDSRGRLWGGTMSLDAGAVSGALYMFGPGGEWICRDRGFHVSNGLDWSPDDRSMYFCDTNAGIIYAYDFDVETGAIANRRPFVQEPADRGKPDGLTVDEEGTIWCAFWDGWCVRRYDPAGRLVETLELPVPRPSSCCFGGPDLGTLYITTARIRLTEAALSEAPLSGHLLAYRPGVRGRKANRYRL